MLSWRLGVLRRAAIVLAWLMLALSVPAAGSEPRSGAAEICSIVASAVAAPMARRTVGAPRQHAAPRRARVSSVARAARLAHGLAAALRHPGGAPASDGRRLYLANAALLC